LDDFLQVRGHPFMMSTRRGDVRLRWMHANGGRGSAPCGHSHSKYWN